MEERLEVYIALPPRSFIIRVHYLFDSFELRVQAVQVSNQPRSLGSVGKICKIAPQLPNPAIKFGDQKYITGRRGEGVLM